jgi:hypothetical protein
MARRAVMLSLAALPLLGALISIPAGALASPAATTASAGTRAVTSSGLGTFTPTFTGPAATGCAAGCSLLTGPVRSPSTAGPAAAAPSRAASTAGPAAGPGGELMPPPRRPLATHGAIRRNAVTALPSVSCRPLGPGCDQISRSAGNAVGVKGLKVVDSSGLSTNVTGRDNEPPDQGLCASNRFVVESDNIGEILVFDKALNRKSAPIPLDTVMDLTPRGLSSGGDVSCAFDYSNGGHWFFTEFVSKGLTANGGPFANCFAGVASTCFEGMAVTTGPDPFGPYNVYLLNANYNPAEPGYPFLLNDFTKIGMTRDAFLMFYDEFPQNAGAPGFGGGGFNGAQEYAFSKSALETGQPVTLSNGKPNPFFNVAIENMGTLATPDGTCAGTAGVACWAAAIPAMPPDPTQFDNSHGGSGFMLASLDFNSFAGLTPTGDNRMAVFDWTGLRGLNSPGCIGCGQVRFGGQLFSGVLPYNDAGQNAMQKAGPIPLGDMCGAAGLSVSPAPGVPPPASCPENGLSTNGDFMTQVSQAGGRLWGATNTQINQTFAGQASPETRQGIIYWVVGTGSFDRSGTFSLTSQGYASAAHEDLDMPAIAASGFPFQDGGNGAAVITFTLSGNGGPTGADNGGFFPSTAYGRISSTSAGLLSSTLNIADLGQAPQDGFTEYLGFPGATPSRWGDYSAAVFSPGFGGGFYFANEYIQFPNCLPPAFTLTHATCGGTRDGRANWGTSVNFARP